MDLYEWTWNPDYFTYSTFSRPSASLPATRPSQTADLGTCTFQTAAGYLQPLLPRPFQLREARKALQLAPPFRGRRTLCARLPCALPSHSCKRWRASSRQPSLAGARTRGLVPQPTPDPSSGE